MAGEPSTEEGWQMNASTKRKSMKRPAEPDHVAATVTLAAYVSAQSLSHEAGMLAP
jgi:hypothetical protein